MDECTLLFCPKCRNRQRQAGDRYCAECQHVRTLRNFWSKVIKSDGCWEWGGYCCNRAGYGRILYLGEVVNAHRVSWMIANPGVSADGLFVCHTCDNPPCVNPAHLFLGTPADNAADMAQKKRSTIGSRNPRAKLTEPDVVLMRQLFAAGWSRRALGERFGILETSVTTILLRITWKHV